MNFRRGSQNWLAIDLGAESGRAVLGSLDSRGLHIKEIHRFPNLKIIIGGHQHWDAHYLLNEILKSIQSGVAVTKGQLASIGIDTWGVDFGLLDSRGQLLSLPFTYRDKLSHNAMTGFLGVFTKHKLYHLTGNQFLPFNSVFQLRAMKSRYPNMLKKADSLLFIPDILNYFLTGNKVTEFTVATTSQLFNPVKRNWEKKIFDALGIPIRIMQKIVIPGTVMGSTKPGLISDVFKSGIKVIAVGSHDTASAVASVPASGRDWAYISSGTWSLMGVETREPIINDKALRFNFTNEGGVNGNFRFLKNITGLWLLQQCRQEWMKDKNCSYGELMIQSKRAPAFAALVDPDAPEFMNPPSMTKAIRDFCARSGQQLPASRYEFTRCIIESLALKYKFVFDQLQSIYSHKINQVHIIGGGSKNELLCQYTANALGLPIIAGPTEATSIGNIGVQAWSSGAVGSLNELRKLVAKSFRLKVYKPRDGGVWQDAFSRYLVLIAKGV